MTVAAAAAAVLDVIVAESTGLEVETLLLLCDTVGSVTITELLIVTVDSVTIVTVVAEVMVVSLVDTVKVVGVTTVVSLVVANEAVVVPKTQKPTT